MIVTAKLIYSQLTIIYGIDTVNEVIMECQIKPDSNAKPQFTQANSAAVSACGGFTFNLSSAKFDDIGNGLLSPAGSDFDYTSGNLSPRVLQALLTQSSDVTSDWRSSNPADDLLIDSGPTSGEPFAGAALKKSPEGVSSEVSLPAASWQSLPLLVLIAVLPAARKKLAKSRSRA
jgi:hypothetical protein